MDNISKKFGLLYTEDFHTVLGVDSSSKEFTGRVPFGPKEIADKAFQGVNYDTISLPDSVKFVGFNLFENAAGVRSIKLPSALSELTPYMFSGCASLVKVNMPSVVTEFPEHIFYRCSSLQEAPFRTDISYIGVSAFEKCSGIKSLAFPDTVQTVESRAFADCTSLGSVVIGAGVYDIADDAFAGCNFVNHIRLNEANTNFYIGDDGSLYRTSDGKIIIKVYRAEKQTVSFFADSESLDDEEEEKNPSNPVWIDEDDEEEEDDTFSAEIGADDEEGRSIGMEAGEIAADETKSEEIIAKNVAESSIEGDNCNIDDKIDTSEVEKTSDNDYTDYHAEQKTEVEIKQEDNMAQTDAMLASIMGQNSSAGEEEIDSSVSISVDELAGVVSAMNDTNGTYTEDVAQAKALEKNINILRNSAKYSFVQDYETPGEPLTEPNLYVIAENLIIDSFGNRSVSARLKSCCDNLVKIHDFKRVIYVSGLPLENDEFVMFLTNVLNRQNVIVACEATSPSKLSYYCKQACEIAGISLAREDMIEQNRKAGVKTQKIIKMVVQDKY